MDPGADLRSLLASRYPLLIVEARDEPRFLIMLRAAADAVSAPTWTWSATRGLNRMGFQAQYDTVDPNKALAFVQTLTDPGVFVFEDAQRLFTDPIFVRRVKEIAQAARKGQTLVITGSGHAVPDDLEDLALPWVMPAPDPTELEGAVQGVMNDLVAGGTKVNVSTEDLQKIVEAVRGMTTGEAERLIRRAASDGTLDATDVEGIRNERAQAEADSGALEIVGTEGTVDDVGGMDHLKQWLALRQKAMTAGAEAFGIDPPRGILLTGVPGCGKSMMAKAVAKTWNFPLALLDPARLFGSYVGESEGRLSKALDQADAMSPVVLWIDEIEKGFAQGGESDGGVAQRMLGTFLRWMQERTSAVFLVATSNDVSHLPPEFLRKGRFDEIFFVDLPGPDQREAIFATHLKQRHRDPTKFDLKALAAASDGFSGAEIEAAVVGALYRAFASSADVTTDSIVTELKGTVPLSRSRAEDIMALRAWASQRAVPA
ncbi:MAG TPA: AAA family ATPase [Actinomycetota bacterium]|nr:AAA family ATPase [Actinomycetota bacterium]